MAEANDAIIIALCAWTALVYVLFARHLLLYAQLYVPEGEEVQQRGSRTGAVVAHTLIAGLFAAVAVQQENVWGCGVAGGLAAVGYIIFWATTALGPPPRGIVNTREPQYRQVGYGIGNTLVQGGLSCFFFSGAPPEDPLRLVLSIAFAAATVAICFPVNKWAQSSVAEVRSKEGPSPSVVGAPSGAPAADPEVRAVQDVVPNLKFTKEMANDRLRAPYRCMAVLIHVQVAIFVVYMLSLLSWFE